MTHVARRVRADEREDDALFIAALASVGRQNLDVWVQRELLREKLDLLAIERDDPDVFLVDAACSESGHSLRSEGSACEAMALRKYAYLFYEDCFRGIVDERAVAAFPRWQSVRVDEDDASTMCDASAISKADLEALHSLRIDDVPHPRLDAQLRHILPHFKLPPADTLVANLEPTRVHELIR